jgi:hypothetical protein
MNVLTKEEQLKVIDLIQEMLSDGMDFDAAMDSDDRWIELDKKAMSLDEYLMPSSIIKRAFELLKEEIKNG